MSYDPKSQFYANTNIRPQQMMNPIRGSTNYNMSTSQNPMSNQYQSYPSQYSHQNYPSYETYDSHPTNYYSPNTNAYDQSTGQMPYAENHFPTATHPSKDTNVSSTMNDFNPRTRPTTNMMMPTKQMPPSNFGYQNTSATPAHSSPAHQQQMYYNYSQYPQNGMYDTSGTSQYPSSHPTVTSSYFPTPNANTYRPYYQNEPNVSAGKPMPYHQQPRYPSLPPEPNGYNTYSTIDPNDAHSQAYPQPSMNEYQLPTGPENDAETSKLRPPQSNMMCKSPSGTSISSCVPDDVDSSNSSFSDNPSISNDKTAPKRKPSQTSSAEVFNKLREMGSEPERNLFIDRLQKLWEEHHVTYRKLPSISRQIIDLYRLYVYVREQNGFEQFSKIAKNRHWRDIASKLNIPNTSTAPFHVKQKYIDYKLLHYECKYDRGGVDPEVVLADMNKPQEKQSKAIAKTNKEKLRVVEDHPGQLSSIEQTHKDNLPSQTNASIECAISQQPITTSVSSIFSTNQQVPTLVNSLSQKPDDASDLKSISRPILFPANSIEATTISSKIKRKKLTMKDIPPIDSLKLLMSLRAGLLAESSRALDTLNVMLSDDQAHIYLQLKQMPGVLSAIVDIYTKCLTDLFDEFKLENEQTVLNGCRHRDEQDSIAYRIESSYLSRYQRRYNKQQTVVYESVYDDRGNLKNCPKKALNLQNTEDLGYIQTHFDPLHKQDHYYEGLYYGHHSDDTLSSDEHDQEPVKKSPASSPKQTAANDRVLLMDTSDSNKEFLQRYKRKFQSNGVSSDAYSTDATLNGNNENSSALFCQYSFAYDQICSRCICVSSILRNLSFIPGNDVELVKHRPLMHILARLLLLGHSADHNIESNLLSNEQDKESSDSSSASKTATEVDNSNTSSSFSLSECLVNIRENTLVTLANIAGSIVFDSYDSQLINQLIDGLLHWATCCAAEAKDLLESSYASAQHLSIEILTKLSVHDMNMDFILATNSFSSIVSLFHILTSWLNVDNSNGLMANTSRSQAYIQRELAIVLINALTRSDSDAARVIARIPYTILLLINFLEDYEKRTNDLVLRYGSEYVLRLINSQEAEQVLLTTSDMLTRAATCLLSMTNSSDNTQLMKKYEDRIFNLSISNVIDRNVGRILTDILHHCSLNDS